MNRIHYYIGKKPMIPAKEQFCGLDDLINTDNYDVSRAKAHSFFYCRDPKDQFVMNWHKTKVGDSPA